MRVYESMLSSLDIDLDGNIIKQEEVRVMELKDVMLSRTELFEEIWELSVAGVARKYDVDYANLLRICHESNVPIPSQKYWANKTMGKEVEKENLPESDIETINIAMANQRPSESIIEVEQSEESTEPLVEVLETIHEKYKDKLVFMDEDERIRVFHHASKIAINNGKKRFSKKISEYKKKVEEWNKKDIKAPFAKRAPQSYSSPQRLFLAGVVSGETLPRVLRIIETLGECIEKEGGKLTDDLSLTVRGEKVSLKIHEYQDRIDHVLTNDEKYRLLKYEDDRKRGGYAYKPNLQKYDYIFNGRLNVSIKGGKTFKDSKTNTIENLLDLILIELYEQSEVNRLQRLAEEEKHRIRAEEKERERLFTERKNDEIEATIELKNCALDFDTACKIRAFIEAVSCREEKSDELTKWIEWASKKADWYDPAVAYEDEYLGVRDHGKDKEYKQFKKSYRYW